jgi:putative flippase GtrA
MDIRHVGRYLASGATGLVVNLGTYRLLVAYAGLHYLLGSMLAFTASTVVGFSMQKYWTFAEREHKNAPRQLALYVSLALFNLGLNTMIVFLGVSMIGLHYLLAQTFGAAIVSVWSYFVYRHFVFAGGTTIAQSDTSGAPRQS